MLRVIVIAYLWLRGPRLVALVATIGFLLLQVIMLLLTPSTADYWITQFPSLFGQAFPFLDNQSLNATIARASPPAPTPPCPP